MTDLQHAASHGRRQVGRQTHPRLAASDLERAVCRPGEVLHEGRAEGGRETRRLDLCLTDELAGQTVLQDGAHDRAPKCSAELPVGIEQTRRGSGEPRIHPLHGDRRHRREGAAQSDAGKNQRRQIGELAGVQR